MGIGLRLVDFRCDRRERAMIRDRDPGADRNCDGAQRVRAFTLRLIVEPRPILKSFPVNRALARLSLKVTPSGATTSGTSVTDGTANRGCSTRVAITAAANSSAAARK